MALSRSGARRAVAGGSKGPRPLHHLVPLQPCAFSFFALPLGPSWSKRELSIWLLVSNFEIALPRENSRGVWK